MLLVTCPRCFDRVKLPKKPPERAINCPACMAQVSMPRLLSAGATVPPDLPTPASLRILRLPETPKPVYAESVGRTDPRGEEVTPDNGPHNGYTATTTIGVFAVLAAAVGLALALTR